MSSIIIPEGYQSLLGLYDTQKAIGLIKTIFQEKLCMALHLKRVTAPLFVMQGSGLNDDLNGVERPVSFDVPSLVLMVIGGILGGMLGRTCNKRMDNAAVNKLFIGLMGVIMLFCCYNVWQYSAGV